MTDPSHDGAEDGFHEIQLSGKQLVFLFMATTVISVMIFLCGVLVGRGVKGETVSAAEQTAAAPAPAPAETTPVADAGGTPPPAADDPGKLSYPDTLKDEKPANSFKPAPENKAAAAEPAPAKAEAPPPAPEPKLETPPAPRTAAPPNGKPLPGVWAVQVVALSDRAAANAVAQRLQAKSYPAFVVEPQPNAPVQTYKVQVGKFGDRSEAEQVKNRLKKEEQFEPIIRR